jgi:predicted RNA polymerase sigma factor
MSPRSVGKETAAPGRFQDMAVAYGYATLGDWQLAEDAAQEAFIAAYCELPASRDPFAASSCGSRARPHRPVSDLQVRPV